MKALWYRMIVSLIVIQVPVTMGQTIDYRELREMVEALANWQPGGKTNIIITGISEQTLNSWAILLMQIDEYIKFRTKDETINLVDVSTTFQNILSVKDELMKALRDKALSPQSNAIQLLENVNYMMKNKLSKIKNVPVSGLYHQYDLWYLLQKMTEFLNKFSTRILSDLAKLQPKKRK